jgi:hypothetical protein
VNRRDSNLAPHDYKFEALCFSQTIEFLYFFSIHVCDIYIYIYIYSYIEMDVKGKAWRLGSEIMR